jgi:hypothetical protein
MALDELNCIFRAFGFKLGLTWLKGIYGMTAQDSFLGRYVIDHVVRFSYRVRSLRSLKVFFVKKFQRIR